MPAHPARPPPRASLDSPPDPHPRGRCRCSSSFSYRSSVTAPSSPPSASCCCCARCRRCSCCCCAPARGRSYSICVRASSRRCRPMQLRTLCTLRTLCALPTLQYARYAHYACTCVTRVTHVPTRDPSYTRHTRVISVQGLVDDNGWRVAEYKRPVSLAVSTGRCTHPSRRSNLRRASAEAWSVARADLGCDRLCDAPGRPTAHHSSLAAHSSVIAPSPSLTAHRHQLGRPGGTRAHPFRGNAARLERHATRLDRGGLRRAAAPRPRRAARVSGMRVGALPPAPRRAPVTAEIDVVGSCLGKRGVISRL